MASDADDAEVVDAVPVPEGPSTVHAAPTVAPSRGGLVASSPVTMQAAAAVAVTGFAAGAATVAVVRRRRARRALGGRKSFGDVRASRSFLVDIHLLNRG